MHKKIFNRISCVINCLMFRLFSSRAGAPQKVKLVDRGKRSAIIFCRMRVLHKTGNDSNLLIVFYVQIMPDDFVMRSTDFENDSDFRPSRARCCLRFRLCRSIRCVYRLLITCSFPFRRDSYSGQPSVIHITTSKGDSRLIRRPSVAIVRSPNTCATTVFRSLSYA